MASIQTIIEEARVLLKAGALPRAFGLEEADYAGLARAALARYSRDRPLAAFADLEGDGASFDFPLPADWDDSLSVVRAVEYPQGRRTPVFLQRRDWSVYAKGGPGARLRLLRHTPRAGERARLFYTRRHEADEERASVPANDLTAVAWLAAAEGCGLLARRFAQSAPPTLAADSADYPGKAGEYARLARELERKYRNHVGQREGEPAAAAGASLDWDAGLSGRRGEYVTRGAPDER